MKLAINARWLIPNKLEGFGWYSFHVIKALQQILPDWDFYLLYDRKINAPLIEGLNIHNYTIYPPARHPILWSIWNQFSVPLALKIIKPDAYFSPDGFLPYKAKLPMLTTIHDLNFEGDHHFVAPTIKRYYQKHIRQAADVAQHIFTVSEFSKDDIISRYAIKPEKISFAHNGPQQVFQDLSQHKRTMQYRFSGTHDYFLFVGAQNPRKNLHRIFEAFDAFCHKHPKRYHLVLVGERMYWDDDIRMAWENMAHKDRVNFTGRLSSEFLNKLYSGAQALLYPSLFEGFGMPIIEAFFAGTPVITSLGTAAPEVAGDAALLVDPTRTEEITNAMLRLANDAELVRALRMKGFERAQKFNWQHAASQIAEKLVSLTHA